MAPALQCPACGFRHRLDAVADTPVFPCARCSRQLKVPSEYRSGAVAGSASRPAPPRAAADARTASAPTGRTRTSASTARTGRSGWRPSGEPMRLPVRILLWVVALLVSALIVRSFAKWTGIAGSQQVLDSMIDDGFGTYFRLFILVPIWGLFATILATLFIDGPAWWARRSSRPTAPLKQKVPATAVAGTAGATARSSKPAGARKVPTRPPAAGTAPRPVPATKSTASPRPAPGSAGGVSGAAAGARRPPRQPAPEPAVPTETAVQRPRRIPRRETGS